MFKKKNMGITKVDELKAPQSRAKIVSDLDTTPTAYYSTGAHNVDSVEWRGGEISYLSTENRFYIQTATSGVTAVWRRFLPQTVSV